MSCPSPDFEGALARNLARIHAAADALRTSRRFYWRNASWRRCMFRTWYGATVDLAFHRKFRRRREIQDTLA
jgi:hypothetical protein